MATALSTADISQLPPWAQQTALDIQKLGLEALFFPEYKLADMGKVLQIRDTEDLAPKHKVEEYAANMRNGDQFPPVIFTTDDWLVDGATRTLAADKVQRRDNKTFPAFRLRNAVYGENPPASLLEKLVTLGGGKNISHGENLKAKNRARIIEWVADTKGPNPSVEDLARQLHVKRTFARDVLNVRDARVQAERLGVDLSARRLSWTHMTKLGTASHQNNDGPYAALARLTVMTSLSTTELQSLIQRLHDCSTDEERLAILAGEARSRVVNSTGVNRRPPVPAQLRQRLGWLEKNMTDDPSVVVESSSLELAQAQLESIQRCRALLGKAAVRQNNWIEECLAREQA